MRKRMRVTPASVIATAALVFATTGGAYAANHFLITSTKQISPKVLKALKGAGGKDGTAGPAGAAGAGGPQGPGGAKGETGPAGVKGEKGAIGEKGAPGEKGPEGSPWTAGGTLPSGKSETGAWSLSTSNEELIVTTVSFPIPLAAALGASAAHYVGPGDTATGCSGSATDPKAAAGTLCVYQSAALRVALKPSSQTADVVTFTPGATIAQLEGAPTTVEGVGKTGAALGFTPSEPGTHLAWGTWAVTAP